MFVFLRLLLAHLLADFALQTDLIYKLRVKYSWGVVFHSSVFAVFSLLCLIPYLSAGRTWFLILILWGSHTVLDKLKINYIVSTGEDSIWWFLMDQLVHVVIIAGVSIALLSNEVIELPWFYHGIYYSDLFFKFANGYIFSLFVPVALFYYIEKTWWAGSKNVLYPSPYFKYTGVIERMAVLTFLLAGKPYYYFIPLPVIFSWYLQRMGREKDSFLVPRLTLSLLTCVLTSAWLLRQF